MIIAVMLAEASGSPSSEILQHIWENDVTPCEDYDCAETAMGVYRRDGAEKPFRLLRRSRKGGNGADSALIHLAFLSTLGDKYIIASRFHPKINKIETRQVTLLSDIDPDRPRVVSASMYEELRNTNITPLFLTLSLHLVKKYREEIHDGDELEAIVDKEAYAFLPHKIYVRVERQNGLTAPVEVQMYRDDAVISTIYMKNAIANGRLRPFWIRLSSREKTDEIQIDFWGVTKNNHEFFTPTGLGRGELSIPEISKKVVCPPEICEKK